jgi:hypothetical protein
MIKERADPADGLAQPLPRGHGACGGFGGGERRDVRVVFDQRSGVVAARVPHHLGGAVDDADGRRIREQRHGTVHERVRNGSQLLL